MNHVRSYAWSKRGTRAVVARPGIRGKAHSLLLCVSSTGVIFYHLYEGAVTAARFSQLLGTIPCGSRVVLDNAQIHKATNVLRRQDQFTAPEMAEGRQITLTYLPPYAPMLNPVELLFNNIRTYVRRLAPRNATSLRAAVAEAVGQLSPAVCVDTVAKVYQ